MNKILSKRYAFCDFSKIVGFPNPVPSRDEWENSLPRFRGEEWEVPAEHLLDFHDYMHRLQVVHEDVQIRLFCFSLEGIARDWYRSLPYASINSLEDFHAAFHVFCKDHFPNDLLYPECCHEFHLLTKDSDVNEEYVVTENTLRYQEIDDSHYDNHCDALNIVLNASFKDDCDDDPIIHFENLKNDEQIDISAGDNFRSTTNTKGSLEFLDLQTKVVCSRYEEEGEEKKGSDQKPSMHFSPTKVEQFTFIIEIKEDSQQHHFRLQSEQKLEEVFLYYFIDPIADFLESLSSIKIKILLSDEGCFYHFFGTHLCWLRILLSLGSRSRMLSANKFLTWLHWKHEFT
jgi:hypothetical protein